MNRIILFVSFLLIIWFFIPIYEKPRVIKGVLSKQDCDHIRKIAEPNLQPSTVGGDYELDNSERKSETAWIKASEDPIVDKLIRKCISTTDRPFVNCEDLQVLRYKPGGFYKPHQDTFCEDKNRRMYTFIIALNDEYEGGETVFPNIKKQYRLEKGDALFFNTLNNYECMTAKAIHGGAPVKSGEKWVCNLWVHKYEYTGPKK
jgi:predicted 2-oxoglutarate/Fe(II)-dependent dioxygenase YbiX